MNRKELDSFIHDIELLIPVTDTNSKRFLADMRESIEDFISTSERADRQMIVSKFGSPKDIAIDYVESLDADDLIKHISTAKTIRRLLSIIAIVAIIALAVFSYHQYRGYRDYKNSLITNEETQMFDGEEP